MVTFDPKIPVNKRGKPDYSFLVNDFAPYDNGKMGLACSEKGVNNITLAIMPKIEEDEEENPNYNWIWILIVSLVSALCIVLGIFYIWKQK